MMKHSRKTVAVSIVGILTLSSCSSSDNQSGGSEGGPIIFTPTETTSTLPIGDREGDETEAEQEEAEDPIAPEGFSREDELSDFNEEGSEGENSERPPDSIPTEVTLPDEGEPPMNSLPEIGYSPNERPRGSYPTARPPLDEELPSLIFIEDENRTVVSPIPRIPGRAAWEWSEIMFPGIVNESENLIGDDPSVTPEVFDYSEFIVAMNDAANSDVSADVFNEIRLAAIREFEPYLSSTGYNNPEIIVAFSARHPSDPRALYLRVIYSHTGSMDSLSPGKGTFRMTVVRHGDRYHFLSGAG